MWFIKFAFQRNIRKLLNEVYKDPGIWVMDVIIFQTNTSKGHST